MLLVPAICIGSGFVQVPTFFCGVHGAYIGRGIYYDLFDDGARKEF